ncbi:hypothetical protein [Streptomyces mirabilis]|uniref:hypothetical protein n=1 Tax=Streptomyces mirabilis TaxID=68239 RepID=UPI003662EE22
MPTVLTEDAERPAGAADDSDSDRAWVTVRWTAADGRKHTGLTRVDSDSKAGSTTRV